MAPWHEAEQSGAETEFRRAPEAVVNRLQSRTNAVAAAADTRWRMTAGA